MDPSKYLKVYRKQLLEFLVPHYLIHFSLMVVVVVVVVVIRGMMMMMMIPSVL